MLTFIRFCFHFYHHHREQILEMMPKTPLLSPPLLCRYGALVPWTNEASTWPFKTSVPASPSPPCGCTTSGVWASAVTWRCSPTWWRVLTRHLWWRSGASVWITRRRETRPRCTAALRGSGWFPSGGVCALLDLRSTETPVWVSELFFVTL